jgi:hypothetical protein
MGGGHEKNIEDVKVGDSVMGYDTVSKSMKSAVVQELDTPIRDHLYKLTFQDSTTLRLTSEHPLYTQEGWKSIDTQKTYEDIPTLPVTQLKVGDKVLNRYGKYITLTSMLYIPGRVQTYNLKKVSAYNNFFADSYLAHNKGNTTTTDSSGAAVTNPNSTAGNLCHDAQCGSQPSGGGCTPVGCPTTCGLAAQYVSNGCGGVNYCVATAACPSPTPLPIACRDSDGGSSPNVAGKITISAPALPQVLLDTCYNLRVTANADGSKTTQWVDSKGTLGTHVAEKTCTNVYTGAYSDSIIACQYGCSNGACLTAPPTPTVVPATPTPPIFCNSLSPCPDGYDCIQPTMAPCAGGVVMTTDSNGTLSAVSKACAQVMPQQICQKSQCPLRSKGDANCDQTVNEDDFKIIMSAFNNQPLCLNCTADFNKDNKTNVLDYEIWRATVYK